MENSRRSLLKRAVAALLMTIPFRRRARATGTGFTGRWQCDEVCLNIVQTGDNLQVVVECSGESQVHNVRLTSPTNAEGQGSCMVLAGDTISTTYVTGETVQFYRVS